METLKNILMYNVQIPGGTVPVYGILLAFVVLPLLNELIQRSPKTKAQSILQLVARIAAPIVSRLIMPFAALVGPGQPVAPGDVKATDVKGEVEKPAAVDKSKQSGHVNVGTMLAIGVVGLMLAFLTSCVCWQPSNPKFSTPECVIARKTVQCGLQGASVVLAQTLATIPTQQWSSLLDQLKSDGGTAIGCLLADLPSTFSGKLMSANPASAVYKSSAESLFAAYKKKHGYDGVKFCFNTADGKQECR